MAFLIISAFSLGLISVLFIASFWITNTFSALGNGLEVASAYECGLEPVGDSRMKFEVLYYVIGLLYLIFDLELVFLFPLAVLMHSMESLIAFWAGIVFLTILTLGFIFEYSNGVLDLDSSKL